MIKNKRDLEYYLEADRIALGVSRKRPHLISIYESDVIWKYQILLRKNEYYHNCKCNGIFKIPYKILQYRLFRMQVKTGIGVPINVFGPGFSISHIGTIVVNGLARVGKNCRLHPLTCIGMNGRNDDTAEIGDNVYISTGAKIIGKVKIADGVVIGANSVVTKSIEESNITVGGVPAKKISEYGNSFPTERRGADIAQY
ncbi:MAG: serine acetyltransferase [bacterium]|nr:serine acetyltransferase [bacterium]